MFRTHTATTRATSLPPIHCTNPIRYSCCVGRRENVPPFTIIPTPRAVGCKCCRDRLSKRGTILILLKYGPRVCTRSDKPCLWTTPSATIPLPIPTPPRMMIHHWPPPPCTCTVPPLKRATLCWILETTTDNNNQKLRPCAPCTTTPSTGTRCRGRDTHFDRKMKILQAVAVRLFCFCGLTIVGWLCVCACSAVQTKND